MQRAIPQDITERACVETLPVEIVLRELFRWMNIGDAQLLRMVSRGFQAMIPAKQHANMCAHGAHVGSWDIYEIGKSRGDSDARVLYFAAVAGHADMFERALLAEMPWHGDILAAAVLGGSLKIVKLAIDMEQSVTHVVQYRNICGIAARYGWLDILKFARQKVALRRRYFWANGNPPDALSDMVDMDNEFWYKHIASTAAGRGHLHVLQWYLAEGLEITSDAYVCAAKHGRLPIIEFLFEKGCVWTPAAANTAATAGYLDILRWVARIGLPMEMHRVGQSAVRVGNLEIFKWSLEHDCPKSSDYMRSAAWHNHSNIVDWSIDNGFYVDGTVIDAAAAGSSLDTLKLLHSRGYTLDAQLHRFMPRVVVSEWLHDHGYPLSMDVIADAMTAYTHEHDCINTITWARSRGIDWCNNITRRARSCGLFKVLLSAMVQGCPWEMSAEELLETPNEIREYVESLTA
jgi:hypothetical protein